VLAQVELDISTVVFNTTALEMPDEFGNAFDRTDIMLNSIEIPSIHWWHVEHACELIR
jgi:hypothetical protein